jgi:hypothetical protein
MDYQKYLELRILRLKKEVVSLEEELQEIKIGAAKSIINSCLCEIAFRLKAKSR